MPKNFGRRGRPEYVPTRENVNKVSMLIAQGWTNVRIARTIGITIPTLKKHHKFQLADRDVMRDRIEARRLTALFEMGLAGNISAMKEFGRLHEAAAAPIFEDKVDEEREKQGKKERLRQEAETPSDDCANIVPPSSVQ